MRLLIDKGADSMVAKKNGITPLHWASENEVNVRPGLRQQPRDSFPFIDLLPTYLGTFDAT